MALVCAYHYGDGMHTCKICQQTLSADQFYNGVTSRCKECHKRAMRENRAKKVEYYREYDAWRFQNDPRVRERNRRYAKTDAGKESLRRSREKYIAARPIARAAHVMVGNAIRDGRLIKPERCEDCGEVTTSRRLHAHHDDYYKPLDVRWLCADCHVKFHRNEKT